MVSKELLWRTLEHIKANPAEWDQKRFSACFAGWTVRLNDPAVTYSDIRDLAGSALRREGQILSPLDIDREAAQLLGLSREQRIALFCGGNDMADLERLVSALIEGRPLHWSEYHAHAHV